MTFKVTIWDKNKTVGMVRDYRFPVFGGVIPQNQCHGMGRLFAKPPWFMEFEGEVPDNIIWGWALPALDCRAEGLENVTINGKTLDELSGIQRNTDAI